MYHLLLAPKVNRVQVSFTEHVDLDEAKRCRRAIEALGPRLRPGFSVLVDLSHLEEMDPSCAQEIRVGMDYFRDRGVAQIVRVIPDQRKDIGFGIMSLFHYGADVKVQTVETLAEALAVLKAG